MKIDLQIRDLKNGDTSQKTFESLEEAEAWLRERPRYTGVLGVASHHIDRDVSLALKAAKKPLDDEEKKLDADLETARTAAFARLAESQRKASEAQQQQQLAAMVDADPKRPMSVRWRYDTGLAVANKADARALSDVVRAAVDAWVNERNDWVRGRGQVVGEASLQLWPAEIPEENGDERIISGTFIPVTAPRAD